MKQVLFASLLALGLLGRSPSVLAAQAVSSTATSTNPVIFWNKTLLAILRTPGAQPATIHSTRSFAMLHVAIFDAVNNIDGLYSPYLIRLSHVSRKASDAAAADEAAHDVLVGLYPAFQSTLDTELSEQLAQIPTGEARDNGIEVGSIVAAAVLANRADDGANAPQPVFTPGTQAGDYRLTPPNFAPADFTQWPDVTPFAIARADEFRPGPPPRLDSEKYTHAFDQVASLGLVSSTTRTAEQTTIGKFWNGNIQDFWNEIAQTAAEEHNLNIPQTARLFALLNVSLADTTIAFFDAKYFYNFWRPVTAVQLAGQDGNPDTAANTSWLPLSGKTAPDPSYPGAHSAISAAAANVLETLLGDRFTFTVTSESLADVTRSFNSFSAAAEEAGLSRIYAGQHFLTDHEAGKRLGHRVADAVVTTTLLPVRRDRDRDDGEDGDGR